MNYKLTLEKEKEIITNIYNKNTINNIGIQALTLLNIFSSNENKKDSYMRELVQYKEYIYNDLLNNKYNKVYINELGTIEFLIMALNEENAKEK